MKMPRLAWDLLRTSIRQKQPPQLCEGVHSSLALRRLHLQGFKDRVAATDQQRTQAPADMPQAGSGPPAAGSQPAFHPALPLVRVVRTWRSTTVAAGLMGRRGCRGCHQLLHLNWAAVKALPRCLWLPSATACSWSCHISSWAGSAAATTCNTQTCIVSMDKSIVGRDCRRTAARAEASRVLSLPPASICR